MGFITWLTRCFPAGAAARGHPDALQEHRDRPVLPRAGLRGQHLRHWRRGNHPAGDTRQPYIMLFPCRVGLFMKRERCVARRADPRRARRWSTARSCLMRQTPARTASCSCRSCATCCASPARSTRTLRSTRASWTRECSRLCLVACTHCLAAGMQATCLPCAGSTAAHGAGITWWAASSSGAPRRRAL